jgi:hypothetical protein
MNSIFTSLISILESLLVIVPALLSVAFVTIAERKTMASMQRRLGPNIVGKSQNSICQSVRLFYSTSKYKDDITKTLYEDRIAPVKLFESELINSLDNITSLENHKLFFDKYKEKGGIYLIKYKEDENIYYIGRAAPLL